MSQKETSAAVQLVGHRWGMEGAMKFSGLGLGGVRPSTLIWLFSS